MRPPLSAAGGLRPHSSASIDRHKLPSLHSHNTSLPALYLPSQGQSQGPSEIYSTRDVGVSNFISLRTPSSRSSTVFLFMFIPKRLLSRLISEAFVAVGLECGKNEKNSELDLVHALQYWVTHLFSPASAGCCGPPMPCWLPHCFSVTRPTGLHWSLKLSSCIKRPVHPSLSRCTGSVYAHIHRHVRGSVEY